MKRELSGGITSRKRFAGKSDFSAKQVSTTLLLLLLCMLMPQGVNARELGPWNIWALADACGNNDIYGGTNGEGAVPLSSTRYSGTTTITNGYYGLSNTTIGSVTMDLSRFAFRSARDRGWYLYKIDANQCGLFNGNGTPEFAITGLKPDDVVKVTFRGRGTTTTSITFVSGSAKTTGGNTLNANDIIATSNGGYETVAEFIASAKGDVVISTNGGKYSTFITYISIVRSDAASYNFYPAIEIYNLSNGSGSLSIYDKAAPDFQLNGDDARYLYSSNYALNNRIAVNSTDGWSWSNGGLTSSNIMNLAISNLEEADRVVITYQDGTNNLDYKGLYFGSNTQPGSPLLNSEAFKDINNNGELNEDEGEAAIKRDDKVESQAVYTMTHDGHLDLIVFPGAIITKIEIYSDHRALIENKPNYKTTEGGYTMYFDGTGQIKEKSYMVPGGLKVQFGNDNESEVAHVVSTVEGPVAYINDYDGFKMARNGANNIESRVPTTGTYYRFTPEVDGIIHFTYKALSVRYNPYKYGDHGVYWYPGDYNVPDCEEDASSGQPCPYALFEYAKTGQGENDYTYTIKWQQGDFANKDGQGGNNTDALVTVNNDLKVKAGNIYYLYGNWNGDFAQGAYCGVARLMDVTFIPGKFVQPLAKCIDNASKGDSELATVSGYTTSDIHEKAKSSNITGYTATIDNNTNTLKISNITYADGADKAGVILLKLGTGDKDPVFVLTIAYDAAYCSENWDNTKGYTEGHTWDFSSDPLSIGSYWTNFFDTDNNINSGTLTTNTSSQLYDEIENRYDPDGAKAPEWNFKYLSSTSGGNLDPTFINVYDMAGDNADMIWETGGLWFDTESNQSCLFNEKQGSIDRNNKVQRDPQRYVGILKGGEFTIPKLDKDDRVLIYMGNSATSSAGPLAFDITNARDALGKEITSEYRIGGSTFNTWQADGSNHSDPNYQGCYHFFAKGKGDMTFKMVSGTVCKLYKIVIYRGNHRRTNDIARGKQDNGTTESRMVFVNKEGDTKADYGNYTIHYRGKGEVIANPEILVRTGNLSDDSFDEDHLIKNSTGFRFVSTVSDFGVFRVRLKDMDYSGQYVCDFADRNFTVGYKQQKSYPYTWDFTDIPLTDGKGSGEDVQAEDTNYSETTDVHESKGWDLSLWDKDGYMLVCNPDPAVTSDDNYIFYHDSDKNIDNSLKGNQLFANDKIIPETQGLWFYFDNNDPAYNRSMQITSNGLRLANTKRTVNGSNTMGWWNYKMIVPEVPTGAAVYVRMTRDTESVDDDDYSQKPNEEPVYFLQTGFAFGNETKTYLSTDTEVKNGTGYSFFKVEGTDDWILAVKNTKDAASNITFTLNGWIVKKISVSEYSKSVNKLGYASESRAKEIDPELMGYMTGTGLKAYTVDNVTYGNKAGEVPTIKLKVVPTTNVISAAKHHDHNGYIIYNTDAAVNGTKAVGALNNGFHLFVPDMHDRTDGTSKLKPALDVSGNCLRAWLPSDPTTEVMSQTYTYTESEGNITATGAGEGVKEYTTYVLSSKGTNTATGKTETDVERFRRVAANVIAGNNKAYLPLLTENVKPKAGASAKGMFAIVFVDEEEGTETTSLNGVESTERTYSDGCYTLDGVKVQNPTKKGIYIKNGKKIIIK